jgi:hypothetical protein
VQALAPGARPRSNLDIAAPHVKGAGDHAYELVVGASFRGRGGESHAQASGGLAGKLASDGAGRHPDGETQAVTRLGQRRDVTT